jgi:curved DNA-binding protein CbpA
MSAAPKRSFYEMLDVPRNATQAEIDTAFASLTEKLGSDTSVRGNAATQTELNILRDGYRILCDPEKRAMYDAKLHATEHGIKLMFFPKDTKAQKQLGLQTVFFALLACVFTYMIYQRLMHDPGPTGIDQTVVAKKKGAPAPGKAALAAEPAASPPDATANPTDTKAIAKSEEKK